MLERNREKKTCCVPTHLTECEAMHVAEQAYERGWSNSAYIRHLVKQDQKRHLDDSYLMGEVLGVSNKQLEQAELSEQKLKSPVGATTEPNIHSYGGK